MSSVSDSRLARLCCRDITIGIGAQAALKAALKAADESVKAQAAPVKACKAALEEWVKVAEDLAAAEAPSSSSQARIVFTLRRSMALPCRTSDFIKNSTLPTPRAVMIRLVIILPTRSCSTQTLVLAAHALRPAGGCRLCKCASVSTLCRESSCCLCRCFAPGAGSRVGALLH